MLDSGLCDVVVIATPNMTHYQILMDIINHPKTHHVLVEKPLCTTVEDCRKVSYSLNINHLSIFINTSTQYRHSFCLSKKMIYEEKKIKNEAHK